MLTMAYWQLQELVSVGTVPYDIVTYLNDLFVIKVICNTRSVLYCTVLYKPVQTLQELETSTKSQLPTYVRIYLLYVRTVCTSI